MEGAGDPFSLSPENIKSTDRLPGGEGEHLNPLPLQSLGGAAGHLHAAGIAGPHHEDLHRGGQDVGNIRLVDGVPFNPPPVDDDLIADDLEVVPVHFTLHGHGAEVIGVNHGDCSLVSL